MSDLVEGLGNYSLPSSQLSCCFSSICFRSLKIFLGFQSLMFSRTVLTTVSRLQPSRRKRKRNQEQNKGRHRSRERDKQCFSFCFVGFCKFFDRLLLGFCKFFRGVLPGRTQNSLQNKTNNKTTIRKTLFSSLPASKFHSFSQFFLKLFLGKL